MSQDALSMLKQVKHLDDTRVLFSLLEVLDYENLIQVNQAEIARDLECSAKTCSVQLNGSWS